MLLNNKKKLTTDKYNKMAKLPKLYVEPKKSEIKFRNRQIRTAIASEG